MCDKEHCLRTPDRLSQRPQARSCRVRVAGLRPGRRRSRRLRVRGQTPQVLRGAGVSCGSGGAWTTVNADIYQQRGRREAGPAVPGIRESTHRSTRPRCRMLEQLVEWPRQRPQRPAPGRTKRPDNSTQRRARRADSDKFELPTGRSRSATSCPRFRTCRNHPESRSKTSITY